MKKEDLVAKGLTEEQVNYIMAENGKDVNAVKTKLTAAETARDDYKTQLETANNEIKGYKDMDIEGIKTAAANWEKKYNEDTKALQDKLDAQVYTAALEKFVDGYQFTSELAKKAVVAELKEKGFKLDGGTLLGAKDYMEELKTGNPTAFVDPEQKKDPTFVLPGAKPGVQPPKKKLPLSEVMKLKNQNPDMDITPYL